LHALAPLDGAINLQHVDAYAGDVSGALPETPVTRVVISGPGPRLYLEAYTAQRKWSFVYEHGKTYPDDVGTPEDVLDWMAKVTSLLDVGRGGDVGAAETVLGLLGAGLERAGPIPWSQL